MKEQSTHIEVGKFRYYLLATAIAVYLVIVAGGIVRTTGAGGVCGEWLACNGSLLLPDDPQAKLAYVHRLLGLVAGPMVWGAAATAWRRFREVKLITVPLSLAAAGVGVQGGLGAYVALTSTPSWLVGVHFSLSLVVLALITGPAVAAYVFYFDPSQPARLRFRSPFGRYSIWTLAIGFVVLVSGVIVASSGSTFACNGWPLCNGEWLPSHLLGWISLVHRFVVAVGGVFMLILAYRAWRSQRTQRAILTAATTVVILYLAQGFVGALKAVRQFPLYMLALHEATAAALMATAVILVMFVGLAGRTKEEEIEEASIPADSKQRAKDLLNLTKPVIVALLLVTTYAGMVVGAKAFPPFWLMFWTMLGGALAAGGSGAVNHYIDRESDQRMQRTSRRPIASGRMTPAEGLAFGVGLLFIAFYLLAGFVNLLAALLALVGMIYYVLVYSIFLKTTTVQNIVIGGGAGAVPPLVGWAATTGGLDLTAWFLFAIIFMWTPPHFWALALIRQKDYARAGIPMLPVVRGEEETRKQILGYTIVLVGLTVLMGIMKLAGEMYSIAAAVLGLWLISTAWRVWHKGGNKTAWKMYRYSSMYLAFLFAALMVDAVW